MHFYMQTVEFKSERISYRRLDLFKCLFSKKKGLSLVLQSICPLAMCKTVWMQQNEGFFSFLFETTAEDHCGSQLWTLHNSTQGKGNLNHYLKWVQQLITLCTWNASQNTEVTDCRAQINQHTTNKLFTVLKATEFGWIEFRVVSSSL